MPVPADVPLKEPAHWTRDRQRGRAPLRRPAEDQRHPSLHHRREAAGHADRGDDPSAEVRRDGQVVRRRRRQGDARRRRRGARRRAALAVVGEHMWAAIQGRDAVTVEWDETAAETRGTAEIMARVPRARRRRARGDRRARRATAAAAMAGAAQGARGALRVPVSRPCRARAAERGGADERGRRARGLGRAPDARPLPGHRGPGRRRHARTRCGCT